MYYSLAYIPPIIIMWNFLTLLFPNLLRQFTTKVVWEILKVETRLKIYYRNFVDKMNSVLKRVCYNSPDKEDNLYIFVKNGVEVAYLDFDDIIEEKTIPEYDFVWNIIDNNMVRINNIQKILLENDDTTENDNKDCDYDMIENDDTVENDDTT